MHRGTVFIITKNKDNKFKVQKSTEFNGGMGIENKGGVIYKMLQNLKEPLLFDSMIRDFDERYFKYGDKVMTYFPDEQHNPYIEKNGTEYFEYSQTENQFKFFKIETWTNGGVDMIHTFYFYDDYQEIYDKDNVKEKLNELLNNFSIDDEIDKHRQDVHYKRTFTISQSLKDFTEYKKQLENLVDNFITKYHELIYQKFINNDLKKEEIQL